MKHTQPADFYMNAMPFALKIRLNRTSACYFASLPVTRAHMNTVILKELRHHGPFTLLGAGFGVIVLLLLQHFVPGALDSERAKSLFEFSHPLHVFLSAMVTAAMFWNYRGRPKHSKTGMMAVVAVG